MQASRCLLSIYNLPKMRNKVAIVGAALLAFLLFLTTLQLNINGNRGPYATDVGEIQNALPRWGIIHFNGYPLYSILGSAFVTLLRLVGIPPAAGASLFSAAWAAISVGLLVALALAFEVPTVVAAAVALLFALSTSFWIDASVAEVHTMSTALMLATLLFALRFSRGGQRRDLLWLAFLAGQVVAHQPASVLLLPAVAIMMVPQWRAFRATLWRALPAAIGLALLGPLTYLYLPLRVWQGADWVFGTPQTWEGFRHLAMDDKSYVMRPVGMSGDWLRRAERLLELLGDDWPLPLLAAGLLGLLGTARKGRWVETLGLSLAWIPHLVLSLLIWEGRVSDALLAAKLPVLAMSALGMAIAIGVGLRRWTWRWLSAGLAVVWLVLAVFLYVAHRPEVVEITRDPEAERMIDIAAQISLAPDGKPVVVTALWGADYWTLAYALEYRNELPDIRLVKHDADFEGILERGEHLVALSHSFYGWSFQRWERKLGRIYLASWSPWVIEMGKHPLVEEEEIPPGFSLGLGNGVVVRSASLSWTASGSLLLTVYWQAEQDLETDYSVAVHLVSRSPPTGPQDILIQADRDHPVSGWYPTSRWRPQEIVRDHYALQVPAESTPKAVRLSMYQALGNGQFETTEWLSVPVPPAP